MSSDPKANTTVKFMTANKSSSSKPSSPETNPVVVELVFEKLISSVSIDLTCRLHRMMKTGVYPSSDLLVPRSRTEIYPDVYSKNNKTAEEEEKRYSISVPKRNKRKRSGDTEENAYDEYVRAFTKKDKPDEPISGPPGEPSKAPLAAIPAPPPHYKDIFGKMPPKEPKDMVDCLICGRQVNALRFAPHLDKCMGIGTTVRAAALAASGFVPQQMSTVNNSSVSRASSSGVGK